VRAARRRSVDWTAPVVSPASSVSSPCPASLVTVILANSVSQETGSDLIDFPAPAVSRAQDLVRGDDRGLRWPFHAQRAGKLVHGALIGRRDAPADRLL